MTTKVKKSTWDTVDNLGYVSILDTGAKGDGVTDDTAALNAALATGLPVYIPPAIFVIGSVSVPANSVLFGQGNNSILKMKVTNDAQLLAVGSGSKLSNFAIDGNKSNQTTANCHGILVTSAVDTVLSDISVLDTKGDGINITGAGTSNVMLRDCVVTGFTRNGILVETGDVVTLDGCYGGYSDVVASPGNGISISSNGATVSSVTLVNCVARNNVGSGFVLAGNTSKNVTECAVVACQSVSNVTHGFHMVTAERNILSACVAKSNGGDGFRLEGDVQHSRLATNSAYNNGSFGIREVIAGSTPNYNGFTYSVTRTNGNDTVTKVGANSTVVSI